MKKFVMMVAGATILTFTSCEKLKDLAQINVGAQSQNVEFVISVVPAAGDHDLAAAAVQLNIDSIIKAANSSVGVNNIKSAKVTGVHIEVTDADQENNFAVVEGCKVLLSSNTKPDKVTIAELTSNPDEYKASIDVPVNGDVDLADYLKGSNFSYTLWAKTRRGTTKEVHCVAKISYDLTVGLE